MVIGGDFPNVHQVLRYSLPVSGFFGDHRYTVVGPRRGGDQRRFIATLQTNVAEVASEVVLIEIMLHEVIEGVFILKAFNVCLGVPLIIYVTTMLTPYVHHHVLYDANELSLGKGNVVVDVMVRLVGGPSCEFIRFGIALEIFDKPTFISVLLELALFFPSNR